MQQQIIDFLNASRVGVLAVKLPDGSPHAATVHFAHTIDPLVLYFETNKKSRKAQGISDSTPVAASFVIGTSEAEMKTFQMDGQLELIKPEEKEQYGAVYGGKFTEKQGKIRNNDVALLKFTPNWWRYTEMKSPSERTIFSSENS